MANKKKYKKTYILLHRGRSKDKGCIVFGRYRVGAKNKKDALTLLKNEIGKHCNIEVYYEEKSNLLEVGSIIKEV